MPKVNENRPTYNLFPILNDVAKTIDEDNDSFSAWKNKTKIRAIRRSFRTIPLSAFKSNDWYMFIVDNYEKSYGEDYPAYPAYQAQCHLISQYIYEHAFKRRLWSAQDLRDFLVDIFSDSQRKNKINTTFFRNEYCHSLMDQFDEKLKDKRRGDRFELEIHLPHEPINSEKGDLFRVIGKYELQKTQVLYWYGITLYHKYLTTKYKMHSDEAKKEILSIIANDIVKKFSGDKKISMKLLEGMARNSMLWEPYVTEDLRKGILKNEDLVLNWRENEFGQIWEKSGISKSDWWKTTDQTAVIGAISSVHSLLEKEASTLRRQANKNKK